jgi:hypothetical protein
VPRPATDASGKQRQQSSAKGTKGSNNLCSQSYGNASTPQLPAAAVKQDGDDTAQNTKPSVEQMERVEQKRREWLSMFNISVKPGMSRKYELICVFLLPSTLRTFF